MTKICRVIQIKLNQFKKMSVWSLTCHQQSLFKRYHGDQHFSEFLPTRWRQKSTGIDMERNYATVSLCIMCWCYQVGGEWEITWWWFVTNVHLPSGLLWLRKSTATEITRNFGSNFILGNWNPWKVIDSRLHGVGAAVVREVTDVTVAESRTTISCWSSPPDTVTEALISTCLTATLLYLGFTTTANSQRDFQCFRREVGPAIGRLNLLLEYWSFCWSRRYSSYFYRRPMVNKILAGIIIVFRTANGNYNHFILIKVGATAINLRDKDIRKTDVCLGLSLFSSA